MADQPGLEKRKGGRVKEGARRKEESDAATDVSEREALRAERAGEVGRPDVAVVPLRAASVGLASAPAPLRAFVT
jgi:hypothetical protein